MKKNILFVDDEKQILKSFKRLLLQSEYNIFLAESGREALSILEENPINLVITDMRMPSMGGLELLERVKTLYPNTLRIILSGYTEEQEILKALQNNLARMYIFKPWVNEEMIYCIKQMLDFEDMLKEKQLLNIINKIEKFPALLNVYNKMRELIESKADMNEIVEVIGKDPAIVVKILYIVNSSFYGLRTGSIRHAISYLGLNNLKNIILTANLFSIQDEFQSEAEQIWKHAGIVDRLATELYEKVFEERIPDNAANAGLLHDIGKVIMLHVYKNEYADILKSAEFQSKESPLELEKNLIYNTHQELGGVLLNWFGLPHAIVEAAFFHHTPLDERIINKKLLYIIHIANYYGYKIMKIKSDFKLEERVFYEIECSKEEIERVVEEYIKL